MAARRPISWNSLAAPLSAPSQPGRAAPGGHLDDLVGGGSGAGGFVPSPAPAPSRPAASVMPQATTQPAPQPGAAAFPDYLSVDYLLSGVRPGAAPPAPPAPPPVAAAPMPAHVAPEPAPQPPHQVPLLGEAGPADTSSELSPALRASYVALGAAPASEPADASAGQGLDPVSMLRQRSEARDRARAAPVPGPAPARPLAPAAPRPPAGAALPPAPEPAGGVGDAAAFWDGLGVRPENVADERREELLAEVGRSLRELSQGLVEILAARRSVKDEFRIEQTRLQASENNPFKFFPTGEKALARIVVGDEGYMPLDEAIGESLRDIKAHEVAAMAALQAAVTHVLSRLDPKRIEAEGARGAFGGVDKKALWDRFTELHAGFSGDIEGAARDVVSKAFMEAYERQLNQMKGEGQ